MVGRAPTRARGVWRFRLRLSGFSAEGAISKKPRVSEGPVSARSAALGKRKKKASAESATEGLISVLKTLDPWLDVENIIPLNRAFSADCSFPTVPSPAGPAWLGYPDITPSALKDGQTPRTGVLARQIAETAWKLVKLQRVAQEAAPEENWFTGLTTSP